LCSCWRIDTRLSFHKKQKWRRPRGTFPHWNLTNLFYRTQASYGWSRRFPRDKKDVLTLVKKEMCPLRHQWGRQLRRQPHRERDHGSQPRQLSRLPFRTILEEIKIIKTQPPQEVSIEGYRLAKRRHAGGANCHVPLTRKYRQSCKKCRSPHQ
jgi:hypothetical protein